MWPALWLVLLGVRGVDSTTDVAILQSLEFVTPYEFEANNKHLYLVLIGVFCVTIAEES